MPRGPGPREDRVTAIGSVKGEGSGLSVSRGSVIEEEMLSGG